MKKDAASKNNAYTLIELLIGISIISIIFSVGFASYRDFSRRQALTGVTKKIVSDLRTLQQKALAGEKPAGCTTLDGYKVNISSDSYSLYADCSSDILIKTVDLIEDGATLTSTATNNTITFKVLGQGTNLTSAVTITIYSSKIDKSSQVSIGIGGDIQ
jgi:prepilin-type N-terminal cleavage/methylation domain-containing protein